MSEPEHCYDTLVQCGYMPLTVLVNMRWKRDVLEKHNAALAEDHAVHIEDLRREYEESRQSRRRRKPSTERMKNTVKWKRPVSAAETPRRRPKKRTSRCGP